MLSHYYEIVLRIQGHTVANHRLIGRVVGTKESGKDHHVVFSGVQSSVSRVGELCAPESRTGLKNDISQREHFIAIHEKILTAYCLEDETGALPIEAIQLQIARVPDSASIGVDTDGVDTDEVDTDMPDLSERVLA